jgi:hypothetical protein
MLYDGRPAPEGELSQFRMTVGYAGWNVLNYLAGWVSDVTNATASQIS